MNHFQPTTAIPDNPLPEARWMRFIAGKDLDLEVINQKTLIGKAFVDFYNENPEQAVKDLRSAFLDNPQMIREVIGDSNISKIL